MALLTDITGGGAFPMLEKTLAFTAARNRMLAENIANVTTPGYRTQQLDVSAFQAALRDASDRRSPVEKPFRLERTNEFELDEAGFLKTHPSEEPAENLLFQDGTNARIERQMAMLAENAMMNQFAAETLKGYYDGMAKAIRGRVI
ncbi:MAG: flagellar basal body rod protein FlgB [Phycisphaerae bacterium]